ncbi:serine protease snake-like [Bacillus rossius redtenbacheri]|uniref:serine protease snake-like n=1 Tax=Bacillus rossius redtenbacheri TaxID=93214 RepID=UPI002FDE65FA
MLPELRINKISTCGIVENPLIVGGVKAAPNEFPHMAVLGYILKDNSTGWFCGGSLISERFVLTAAHCIDSTKDLPHLVRLGDLDLQNDSDGAAPRDYLISQLITNPFYDQPYRYNDIGLVKLETSVSFNSHVRPACLQRRHISTAKVIATGFGKISARSKEKSNYLMKVTVKLASKEYCNISYQEYFIRRTLQFGVLSSQICAGEDAGGKDTCQGDSGGPLQFVMDDPYCMYCIVGVTSFGKFCGYKNSPAIYTKVSHYLNWIETVVWP